MSSARNRYARLGVKRVINAQGTYTTLGGSLMAPEVLEAMADAAGCFVSITELQEKVGARIAELVGVPAAMVTSGAASAIATATVACMIRDNPPALERLPDTDGLRNEVLIQKAHCSGYEAQIKSTGAKLVWVETREQLDQAIGPRTAMMFFLNRHDPLGQIKREEWIQVGKRRGVPLLNDAAADLPPVGRFSEYVRQGFDLVAFSGGKALCGPQSSGLLLGSLDLINLGRQAISPSMGIGRAMKVGKEEIIGLLTAVERYLEHDHAADWELWKRRASAIIDVLSNIPGVTAREDVPEIANHSPHVIVEWTSSHCELTAAEVVKLLREGDPAIAVLDEGERLLRIAVWTLLDDEPVIVAERIREILETRGRGGEH